MPATLLAATGIVRRHRDRTVLDGVDLTVAAADRTALVGPNGSGKSTLLRILAGLEPADAGRVERHASIAYLPQMAGAGRPEIPVGELVLEGVGVTSAARELERWEARLRGGDLTAIEPQAAALERWLAVGGEDAPARLRAAVSELGLDERLLGRPLGTLSGGQAARAGLAALAIARTDVVLLDEPTNHLDDDGLARLGSLLAALPGAAVIASHDRTLLAAEARTVVELDPQTGKASRYGGGWEAYQRERRVARERAQSAHDEALAERRRVAEAEREIRRRAAASAGRVASRGGAHDGDKHIKEWVRSRADGAASRARKVGARAERIEIPDAPRRTRPLRLALSEAERRRGTVVALRGARLRRGEWSLGPLDLELSFGDRLHLRGPNGAGKSSLLEALAGRLELAGGERRLAPGAVVARLGQDRDALAGGTSLAERAGALAGLEPGAARTALASMGLEAEVAERDPATLSPGELTRAELALIAQRRTSCLLLDEPGNHLDLASLEVLEEALGDWPGALVVATHDHELARNLGLDSCLELGNPSIPGEGGV